MKKWFSDFDTFTENLLMGLKNAPLEASKNKRLILKLIFFVLGSFFALYLIILLLFNLTTNIFYFALRNKEIIITSFFVFCMIYNSVNAKRDRNRKKQEQWFLEEQQRNEKQAVLRYTYLRMFLFKILDERFCSLTEIVKPITPNLLNATPPITIDDEKAIIYYNFLINKIKILPFSQGTDYVRNLLSAHVMSKMQIEGIEGITAPVNDGLIIPLHVDEIKDLGSTALIVLVLDCEAYRTLKENQGDLQSRELIEHI